MDLSLSSAVIAFTGGVLMFLAPCTLPLVPAFLASLVPPQIQVRRYELVFRTILFTLGFTSVFILFGVLTGFIGGILSVYKILLAQIGGVIIFIFGLSLTGVFNLSLFKQGTQITGRMRRIHEKRSTAFLFGTFFALGWTPCAGPILASILLVASQTATALTGGFLLLIFSIGLALPFIVVGFLYDRFVAFLSTYERYVRAIRIMSGLLLMGLGAVLFLEESIRMTHWGFALYSFFGYVPMCTYF